jgi:ketosteroid isomerase-like protein
VSADEDPVLEDAVLAVNQAFYLAHESRDLTAMAAVWEQSDRVVCIHPGWPILRGWSTIEESWQGIFSGPGRNQFICTNEIVHVDADMAWVTLDENMVDGPNTSTVAATNVFSLGPDGWRIIIHHGSPVAFR